MRPEVICGGTIWVFIRSGEGPSRFYDKQPACGAISDNNNRSRFILLKFLGGRSWKGQKAWRGLDTF